MSTPEGHSGPRRDRLHTGLYAYPWSLQDEGIERALTAIQERAGADAVCLPFQYHSGKFLQPHSPTDKVHFTEPAAHHFLPEKNRYAGTAIKPVVSRLAKEHDPLRLAREVTKKKGMELVAWVVCLHNSVLATAHPDLAQQTVYGEPLTFSLCPSHPEVREFLKTLLVDIAVNYEPDVIELESVEYLPFMHDHHHELIGVTFDPFMEVLLGLDFHPSTCEDMSRRGVDVERVAYFVKTMLDRFFATGQEESGVGWEYFASAFLEEPELWKFMRARIDIITDLVKELSETVHDARGIPVRAIVSWWRPLHLAWLEGHSATELIKVADGVSFPFYYDAPGIIREAVHLRRQIRSFERLTACLNAIPPQTRSLEDLQIAVTVLRDFGINDFEFYNYSLIREEVLDWIRIATRS